MVLFLIPVRNSHFKVRDICSLPHRKLFALKQGQCGITAVNMQKPEIAFPLRAHLLKTQTLQWNFLVNETKTVFLKFVISQFLLSATADSINRN